MKTKKEIFDEIENRIHLQGLNMLTKDDNRPWGGFFVIANDSAKKFAKLYFNVEIDNNQTISPKILIVQPNTRLSWQYHHRRAELWRLIEGGAGIVRSMTDEESEKQELCLGEIITLKQGERHRLVGSEEWGVVAEIWMHTDKENLSDEEDIVRIQDDYGRK